MHMHMPMYTMFRYTLMYIMYSETYVIHHEYKEAGARRPGRTVYIYAELQQRRQPHIKTELGSTRFEPHQYN